MKSNSNIYDIDGNILREAGNLTSLTVEEAEKRLNEYKEELQKLPKGEENDHKASVLNVYIKNLSSYIFNYYIIHPEEYAARVKTTEQQVKEAMEDLKKSVEEPENDEYVDFEEVKDKQEDEKD